MSEELDVAAKVGGEILNNPSVRQFLERTTGEPAGELGGLFGDRIRWWRFRQFVKLSKRATELLQEAGLEAQEVPPAVLVPVLEGATLAGDDEDLQERWAALLANAAATPFAIPPSFPYVLGQLDATDAKLLDACFSWPSATAPFEGRGYMHGQEEIHTRCGGQRGGNRGPELRACARQPLPPPADLLESDLRRPGPGDGLAHDARVRTRARVQATGQSRRPTA